MNPIDDLFQRLRANGRKAFMPFVTAGDPDMASTRRLISELAGRGADLMEIGFPYSDPIADGPVIQASYTRALSHHLQIEDIFAGIEQLTASPTYGAKKMPLVAMVAYALVYRRRPEQFVQRAQKAGFSGVIIPDLPCDESADMARLCASRDFKLIHLVTPTTPRERAVQIARQSTGFLYYVSVTGITGERTKLPDELPNQLRWLKTQTKLPICVGFGISRPEHVTMLREVCDGVIVASALVRHLENAGSRPFDQVVTDIGNLVQSLTQALHAP